VQGACHAGARYVIVVDPQPLKSRTATIFGATHCFEDAHSAVQAVTELTEGRLADHAIVTVGLLDQLVVRQALAIVGKRGQVTVTATGHKDEEALAFHPSGLLGYERTIRGALFGSCNPLYDIPRLIRFYQEGVLKVDELITRHYRLEEINEAYTDLREGRLLRGVIVHDQEG
jgi:S-(hydroxymethyl)glutathione dehydrogenase/alcohol dehydrogenase